MPDKIIIIENLSKTYKTDSGKVSALRNIDLEVREGEIFGIIGYSGAGKSTLIRCINGLEQPSEGRVITLGEDVTAASEKEKILLRRKIGMIFQNFNLLEQRNALKNVMFAQEIAGVKRTEAKEKAKKLLEEVGLADKLTAYPSQLSGGQKQRVAIARALACDPKILLCDEATSALDNETSLQITALIAALNEKYGLTVVIVSHQLPVIKSICHRVAVIDNGEICETGTVAEVFSNPRSAAAKRLMINEGEKI